MAGAGIQDFDYPGFDYAPQRTQIARKLALAQALQKQGLDPLQTDRQVGGWAIPISPFEGAAKLLQTYAGGKLTEGAATDQKALADTAQADYRNALIKGLGASGIPDESIDSIAALGSNPMTQQLIPGAVSWGQQQRMIKMLPQILAQMRQQGVPTDQSGQGTVLAPGMAGAPQAPQASNMPVGSDMIMASGMLGMPGLAKIGEHQFEQSKPIVQREGGLTDWQGNQITPPLPKAPEGFGLNRTPNGYELYQLPGAQAIPTFKGQEAGAVSQAQTQNTLHPVTQASGATVPVMGSNIPGVMPKQSPIPMPPPQAAIPGTRQGDPWATMPKIQNPTGIGQGTYQKDLASNMAASSKELVNKYGEASAQANQRKAFNDQALGLVDRADVGPGSDFLTSMKSTLVERFGIPESAFANTPSSNIILNKDLKNAALQRGKQLFGAKFTQGETGIMLNQAAPSATQTRGAIKFLLDTDNAQLDYQLQQSNDLSRYLQQGGDPNRFEGWYAKSFPMSKALERVHTGKTSTQTLHWNDLPK